jgi:AcrR family transcriptional regulator
VLGDRGDDLVRRADQHVRHLTQLVHGQPDPLRTVAAEAGWSSGALRHYFGTRGELLAFACELVIEQVTARLLDLKPTGDMRHAVGQVLLETMPVDAERHADATIAFAFLALGISDPALARAQKMQFTGMYELCLRLIRQLVPEPDTATPETLARRLHAVVDGLTVHVLAGHLSPEQMVEQLNAYLDELAGQRSAPVRISGRS